jgi:hypothetical protein
MNCLVPSPNHPDCQVSRTAAQNNGGCRDNRTSGFVRFGALSSGRTGSETAFLAPNRWFSKNFKTGSLSHSDTSPLNALTIPSTIQAARFRFAA